MQWGQLQGRLGPLGAESRPHPTCGSTRVLSPHLAPGRCQAQGPDSCTQGLPLAAPPPSPPLGEMRVRQDQPHPHDPPPRGPPEPGHRTQRPRTESAAGKGETRGPAPAGGSTGQGPGLLDTGPGPLDTGHTTRSPASKTLSSHQHPHASPHPSSAAVPPRVTCPLAPT